MLKKYIIFKSLVLVGLLVACGESAVTRTRSSLSSDPVPTPQVATLVTVVDATALECSNGGSAIVTYLDANSSGDFDSGDVERSRSKICNGAQGTPGTSGYGAGILVESAPAVSCPAGGSTFTTFVDKNNNALQEEGESTTSFTTLCSGTNGVDGRTAHLSVTLATAMQCPSGGFVYSSSTDGQLAPHVSVVCNGQNGSNGQDGTNGEDARFIMGAVGPAVSGKIYSACHHDYLFFPDPSGGARGWLSFRHQANGSADQGIGSTGFQIWNADISHFALASEVGGVTYCSLQWDPLARRLSYTVVDNQDELGGTQGTIEF
jgi:hypothetical protein